MCKREELAAIVVKVNSTDRSILNLESKVSACNDRYEQMLHRAGEKLLVDAVADLSGERNTMLACRQSLASLEPRLTNAKAKRKKLRKAYSAKLREISKLQ